MKCFVTGGAGFIGSTMIDALIAEGSTVVCYDNFSTGQERFLQGPRPGLRVVRGDLLSPETLREAMQGCDIVFHFAANADVRYGAEHPGRDLEQNTVATFNVLDAMLKCGIKSILFSSTGSIYGESRVIPTPEDAPFPVQTSLYGASKLAGEGLISAFCEAFGMTAWIFRFVSILGERYSHGHVFDFCRQLFDDPGTLRVLGDGTQRKSYLYVGDCISAILRALKTATGKVNIFNLGTDEFIPLKDSVATITTELGLSPRIEYGGGSRGWIGDNPFIYLDCARIRSLGWQPALSIRQGIVRTVRYIRENRWLLDAR
ncbi:MAG: NAD-dependent epimerase/dehydratase family protein [Spirochaetia bacterium]